MPSRIIATKGTLIPISIFAPVGRPASEFAAVEEVVEGVDEAAVDSPGAVKTACAWSVNWKLAGRSELCQFIWKSGARNVTIETMTVVVPLTSWEMGRVILVGVSMREWSQIVASNEVKEATDWQVKAVESFSMNWAQVWPLFLND